MVRHRRLHDIPFHQGQAGKQNNDVLLWDVLFLIAASFSLKSFKSVMGKAKAMNLLPLSLYSATEGFSMV